MKYRYIWLLKVITVYVSNVSIKITLKLHIKSIIYLAHAIQLREHLIKAVSLFIQAYCLRRQRYLLDMYGSLKSTGLHSKWESRGQSCYAGPARIWNYTLNFFTGVWIITRNIFHHREVYGKYNISFCTWSLGSNLRPSAWEALAQTTRLSLLKSTAH